MPRRLRLQYPDAIYHVMARGNGRQNIVRDDVDRGGFAVTDFVSCFLGGFPTTGRPGTFTDTNFSVTNTNNATSDTVIGGTSVATNTSTQNGSTGYTQTSTSNSASPGLSFVPRVGRCGIRGHTALSICLCPLPLFCVSSFAALRLCVRSLSSCFANDQAA